MITEEVPDFEAKQLFRRVTNHASPGQEVHNEVWVPDHVPKMARSGVYIPFTLLASLLHLCTLVHSIKW